MHRMAHLSPMNKPILDNFAQLCRWNSLARPQIYNDASFSSGSRNGSSSPSSVAYIWNNVSGIFNAFHPKVDMSQRNIPFCLLSPFLCDDILRRRGIYEVNFRIRKQRTTRTPLSVTIGYCDSLLSFLTENCRIRWQSITVTLDNPYNEPRLLLG